MRFTSLWSLWRNQPLRFLVVGAANTLLAYLVWAGLFWFLHAFLYDMVILALATIINVTISYLTQKSLVFRTQGNYVREYGRFCVVCAVPILISFGLYPLFVKLLHINPYVAQALILGINAGVSYLGHKHVSFRTAAAGAGFAPVFPDAPAISERN